MGEIVASFAADLLGQSVAVATRARPPRSMARLAAGLALFALLCVLAALFGLRDVPEAARVVLGSALLLALGAMPCGALAISRRPRP